MHRHIESWSVILTSDNISRDKQEYFTVIESLHQEEITTLNEYAPNNGASKYMKQNQIELKGEMDKSTIITGC